MLEWHPAKKGKLAREAKAKMKRVVLVILVLILLVDVAEDGFLGKIKFGLPNHSAKTTVTSSHNHPCSVKSDLQCELASPKAPGRPCHGQTRSERLQVPPTLQIMHCCHASSSGGIPL